MACSWAWCRDSPPRRCSAERRRAATSSGAQWRWLLSLVAAALALGLAAPPGSSRFIAAFVAGIVFKAAGDTT